MKNGSLDIPKSADKPIVGYTLIFVSSQSVGAKVIPPLKANLIFDGFVSFPAMTMLLKNNNIAVATSIFFMIDIISPTRHNPFCAASPLPVR